MAERKRINLALQGGGAHGAYTWGVLDRLLDDEDLEIAAISGTSAGAMNAAALKAGWAKGGREGAQAELAWFWQQMGAMKDNSVWAWFFSGLPMPGAADIGQAMDYSFAGSVADMLSVVTTPYALGPFYRNPMQPIVDKFDFEAVCDKAGPELFVCATKVRDGKIRIFEKDEVTTDALLASACLPTLFRAVEFYDAQSGREEAFWDGGFSGNPALFPLFRSDLPDDVVIVNLNPLEREDIPMLPNEIQSRINEISFNSSLLRELRAVEFVKRLIAEGRVSKDDKKDILIHMISDDTLMQQLSSATKMFPNFFVMKMLREAGYEAADRFLGAHRGQLNHEGTLNLTGMFA